jgi:hypothetical protein
MVDTIFNIIEIVTLLISLASAIAVVTPTDKDNVFLAKIKPFISVLALNFGNAKSKD